MKEELKEILEQTKNETNFFNKAKLLHYLREQKVPLKDIAKELHMNSSYVCHILRLNKLPELVIDGYLADLISITHLFIIARLKDHDQMIQMYEKALGSNLTSQQTEEMVRELLHGVKTEGEKVLREEITALKNEYMHKRNVQIKVLQSRVKGKLTVEVKGSVKQTSDILRNFMRKLTA